MILLGFLTKSIKSPQIWEILFCRAISSVPKRAIFWSIGYNFSYQSGSNVCWRFWNILKNITLWLVTAVALKFACTAPEYFSTENWLGRLFAKTSGHPATTPVQTANVSQFFCRQQKTVQNGQVARYLSCNHHHDLWGDRRSLNAHRWHSCEFVH